MYIVTLMKETKVTGNQAIDLVMSIRPYYATINEESSVYDCDTPGFIHREHDDIDVADMWWDILNYRDQPDRISFYYTPNRWHDSLDTRFTCVLNIDTGDSGEPAARWYTINHDKEDSE